MRAELCSAAGGEMGHYQLCLLFIEAVLVMTGKQPCMAVLQQPEMAGTEQSSHPFLMPGTVGEARKQ